MDWSQSRQWKWNWLFQWLVLGLCTYNKRNPYMIWRMFTKMIKLFHIQCLYAVFPCSHILLYIAVPHVVFSFPWSPMSTWCVPHVPKVCSPCFHVFPTFFPMASPETVHFNVYSLGDCPMILFPPCSKVEFPMMFTWPPKGYWEHWWLQTMVIIFSIIGNFDWEDLKDLPNVPHGAKILEMLPIFIENLFVNVYWEHWWEQTLGLFFHMGDYWY